MTNSRLKISRRPQIMTTMSHYNNDIVQTWTLLLSCLFCLSSLSMERAVAAAASPSSARRTRILIWLRGALDWLVGGRKVFVDQELQSIGYNGRWGGGTMDWGLAASSSGLILSRLRCLLQATHSQPTYLEKLTLYLRNFRSAKKMKHGFLIRPIFLSFIPRNT